jgi:hypothetical protein
MSLFNFPGDRYTYSVGVMYTKFLGLNCDELVLLDLIIATQDVASGTALFDPVMIEEIHGIPPATSIKFLQKFMKIGILDKTGASYVVVMWKIRDLALSSPLYKKYVGSFGNALNVPTVPFTGEYAKEYKVTKAASTLHRMKQDVEDIQSSRADSLRDFHGKMKDKRVSITSDLLSDIPEKTKPLFEQICKILNYSQGTKAMAQFHENLIKYKSPHINAPERFHETVKNYLDRISNGEMAGVNLIKKRVILLSYFKSVMRPKFANMIKGVTEDTADKLAKSPNFKKYVDETLRESKSPVFPYAAKLWHPLNVNGQPYLASPVDEMRLYKTCEVYTDLKPKKEKVCKTKQ